MNTHKTTVLSLFLLFVFVSHVCCNPTDVAISTDTLNRPFLQDKNEVKKIVTDIKKASKAATLEDTFSLTTPVMQESEVFGKKCCIVKYANPEIQDAMVDFVLGLYKIVDTPEWKKWLNVHEGEGEGIRECLEEIGTAAESTFSPRLHEAELFPNLLTGQKLRMDYLSSVLPHKTLEVLSSSTLSDNKCDELLISSPGKKSLGLWADDAIGLISKMRETAPEVVNKNKNGIRKFIKLNIIGAVQQPGWAMRDFDARTTAMNLLASFNAPQDIPLIQQLADQSIVVQNNKVVDDERNPRLIKELAERLCKQLKGNRK